MDIPVSSMMSPINLSEIASSVKCIPLTMQDSIVMDELTQVIVKDSFIYAADRASLYKFSLTGELMSVVNHRGSSPTEYINISDFQVDEDGNVWVLSRNNKALFNYSWDGNLHKKYLWIHGLRDLVSLMEKKCYYMPVMRKAMSIDIHCIYWICKRKNSE